MALQGLFLLELSIVCRSFMAGNIRSPHILDSTTHTLLPGLCCYHFGAEESSARNGPQFRFHPTILLFWYDKVSQLLPLFESPSTSFL